MSCNSAKSKGDLPRNTEHMTRGHDDQARFVEIAGGRKFKRRVYPKVHLNWRHWRRAITDELRQLSAKMQGDDRRLGERIAARADSIDMCITGVKAFECRCGAPLEGSGEFRGGGKPCNSRVCPRCNRNRATVYGRWLRKIVAQVERDHSGAIRPNDQFWNPRRSRHSWKQIVLTAQYDPTDPEDMSTEALRARAQGLRKAFSRIWKGGKVDWPLYWVPRPGEGYDHSVKLKVPGLGADDHSGAFTALEISAGGFVHLHALVFSTWVDGSDNGALMTLGRAGWGDLGQIKHVEHLEGEARHLEIAKYVTKITGVSKGEFFTPEGSAEIVHPHLAARWELALYGRRVSEMYGVFRGIDKPDRDESVPGDGEPTDRSECACARCGAVNDWWEWEGSVESWALLCQSHDVRPFGIAYRDRPPGPPPPVDTKPPAQGPDKQTEMEIG